MIVAIVLAAGTSSRLGRPKQLLEIGGAPMLGRVIHAALSSAVDEVLVVVGHEAGRVAAAIPADTRVRVVQNPDFAQGQASSLRVGLEAAAGAEAAVMLLGDQPGVEAATIGCVIEAWRRTGSPIVQASYGGRPAHPTLLAASVWPELAGLVGDEGARAFLRQHPGLRVAVEVGGAPPEDVDTEADYERVREALEDPGRDASGS